MKVCSPLFAVAIAAAVYAPHTSATECSKLCTDGSTTCTDLAITATTTSVSAPTVACDYASGKQYLSSLKVSSVGNAVITVALKNGANAVVDGVTKTASAPTVTGGTDMCYLEFANAGKADSLTADVSFDVSCASGTTCAANYAATWACQRDPNWCTKDLVGDASSTAKTIPKTTGTWDLTNPDSCPTGYHSYISSLKVGSRANSAFSVSFTGPATVPTAIAGSSVGTCYYEYGQAPADPSALTQDVKVTVTCSDTNANCVVQAKPVWGCNALKCTTVVTGGADQVLTAAPDAASSFVLKKPDAKACPAGQIAYPKNLVVGGKYAAHNVAVKFNNGLTPTPTATVDSCYFAYGLNPVGSSPVTTDVTATITCKDTTKPCTAQYKVDSWECLKPACQATCTDCTDGSAFTSGKSTITPTLKSCSYGYQYLSAFQATATGGDGIKVAFKQGSNTLTPTETDKKTNGVFTDACSWTYADVGKSDTLTADVGVEVTCAVSGGTCPYKYAATWTCQRDPALCALECDDAAPACADQAIAAGGSLELKNTDDCPTFNYLKSLKIGSKSSKNIVVTFDGASARLPKVKTDSCYFSYGQIPANPTTLLKNVKATVKCADSAACTIQASPKWACDAQVCAKKMVPAGTAKTIDAGAKFVISKPSSVAACASGQIAYPKNLIIAGAFTAYSVGVSFNNGLKPTPTESSGDCYFDYGADPVGTSPVSSDVAVTVTCKDPTKPCNIQYKTDWGCKVPSCQTLCTDGCTAKSVTVAGSPVTLSPPTTVTCTGTGVYQYLSSFTASAANGDPITVKFKDGTNVLSSTETNKTTNGIKTDPCSWTYADVGKTATLGHDVSVEVACKDTAATCDFNYAATWTCQRDPALCAMEAAGSDQPIAANGKVELTNTDECPTFNYLKSLKVGSKAKEGMKVTFTGGGVAPTANPTVASCYFEYGQTPTDLMALTDNVKATVQCATSSATCTVQAAPEWACAVPSCAKTVTGGVDRPIAAVGSVVYAKASGFTCTTTGKFAYPKGLVVGGKFTPAYDVKVAFDNGLTPTPTVASGDCYFEFPDPVGTSAVTSDVTATITCKDAKKACKVQVKEPTWGCYTPPDLTKVYTRAEADGKSCQDVSTCASRCAKSYAMGKKDGKVTFVPQLVPADCDCPVLTATPAGDGLTATNDATKMAATFATTDEPSMTIEYSADDHKCKYTYTKAAFTNPFAEKVFKFKTVTPNTDDCVLPNDCDYVCAAEMTVAKQGDAIQVWRKPVGDCPCTNTTAYTNDDGETASGSTGPVAYLFDALSATSISLNTTVDGTTCRLMYEEKPAPPPPAPTDPVTDAPKPSTAPTNAPSPTTPATTTKTGTSAGVSAMGGGAGAGVTTVTLIAAAAGVQAVGLPAN